MQQSAFSLRHNARAVFDRPHEHLAVVDGVRALSIHGVLLYHSFFLVRLFVPAEQFRLFVETTPWYLAWVWNLDKSVDAFFVISGFLIARLLMTECRHTGQLQLGRFYWHRYLRLTPVYFVAILLYAMVVPGDPLRLLANLFYVNNFLPVNDMAMPWTWSLAVEEQFYLLFPPLLLLAVRFRAVGLLVAALMTLSVLIPLVVVANDSLLWNQPASSYFTDATLLAHYFDRFYVNLYTRFGPFVAGIGLAWVLVYHGDKARSFARKVVPVSLMTALSLGFLVHSLAFHPYSGEMGVLESRLKLVLDRTVFGVALAWILFACLHPNPMMRPLAGVLGWKRWYPFAQLAYSLYLFHYLVAGLVVANVLMNLKHFGLAGESIPHHWLLIAYAVTTLVCLPVCFLLFVAVEKPFMNLRKKSSGVDTPPIFIQKISNI